jgi:branched-chain amino acid transport system ATP-binding protein
MSVRQNVLLWRALPDAWRILVNALRLPLVARGEHAGASARELIELLDLGAVAARQSGRPSFGSKASSSRARLASKPNLLLLDEPAAGLNHEELEGLMALIRRVRMGCESLCCWLSIT